MASYAIKELQENETKYLQDSNKKLYYVVQKHGILRRKQNTIGSQSGYLDVISKKKRKEKILNQVNRGKMHLHLIFDDVKTISMVWYGHL
jgi:hypothetical protein